MKQLIIILSLILSLSSLANEAYLVINPNHFSIVFSTAGLDLEVLPKDKDYTQYKYLDISMGEDPYFYKKNQNIQDAARAMLIPTASLIRLHPFNGNIVEHFSNKKVIPIKLSQNQQNKFLKNLNKEFKSKKMKHVLKVENKFFYERVGSYHLFNTCVHWTLMNLNKVNFNFIEFYRMVL